MDQSQKLPFRIIGLVVIIIVLIIVVIKSSVTINAGEAGVLFRPFNGGVDKSQQYSEGFHFIAPWNEMIIYNIKQQTQQESMSVLSSNGLEITVDITVQFQPIAKKLPYLHQEKGTNYIEDIVIPAARAATRAVIGRYTPEEIYSTKREAIQSEIFDEIQEILEKQYVQINAVLVRDITLPLTIKNAIETKLKFEQESQAYKYKLDKEKQEAERIRIEAEGKAEANRILNASLTTNILKEKGIQATLKLAESPNSKIVVVGNSDGLPLILGNN